MLLVRTVLLALITILGGLGPRATPALAQGTPTPGNLRDLLQFVPLMPLGGESQATVYYGDPALQLETLGLSAPDGPDDQSAVDDWIARLGSLVIHSRASSMVQPDWEAFFGFWLFDIDQVIEFAAPPPSLTVMRGRFDPDALVQQWEASGYQERDWATGTYYTIGDDFEVNFESAGSRLALASANYLAVLAPGLIAFAPSELLITTVLDLAAGTGQSLADELNIASLLEGVPDELVSGTLVSGSGLVAVGDPGEIFLVGTPGAGNLDDVATRMAEENAAAGAMPPITVALLGSTTGGPVGELATSTLSPEDIPAARGVAVVGTVNDSAAWTVAEAIDTRLRHDDGVLPWSDFFTNWSVHVVEEEPVARVELDLAPNTRATILFDLLQRRELGFLAWSP